MAATGFAVTPPTPVHGQAKVATGNITVTPVGGNVAADTVITPHADKAGTFTPSTRTITSGTATAVTFTFTPDASLSTASTPVSITFTNDQSLTNDAAFVYTVDPFLVAPAITNVTASGCAVTANVIGGSGTITYAWTWSTKPAGSSPSFTPNATTRDPAGTFDLGGAYVATLVATDANSLTATGTAGTMPPRIATGTVSFLGPGRIRVTYDPTTVSKPITGSLLGFSLTSSGVSVTPSRMEPAGDYALDLLFPLPLYAGSTPLLSYSNSTGIVSDAGGRAADNFTNTAVNETNLPAALAVGLTEENNTIELAGGHSYQIQTWLLPGSIPDLFAVLAANSGPVIILAYAPHATAILSIKSSADNGVNDAYAARTVRDEAGNATATPTVISPATCRFTLENLAERYLSISSDQAVRLVISSRAPLTRLAKTGIP